MNARAESVVTDFFVDDMDNEDYHDPLRGLGSSMIKSYIDDPASLIWGQSVKQDRSKLKTIDFGTDFHKYFLEPESFSELYNVLPEFNRRKADEKQAELDFIKQWQDKGIVPIKHEDMEKVKAMRDSALAHPTVAAIMGLEGVAERSYFWQDKKTALACKCRPDWLVTDIDDTNRLPFMTTDQTTLVMDVKTIAQFDKMQNQIEALKYYLQDAFYTKGVEQVTNSKVCFVFAFVSTSLSLGRYPVKVVQLTDTARFDGAQMVREALDGYAQRINKEESASWQTVTMMDRPAWATRDDDVFL